MRTTIDINNDLLNEVMALSHVQTKKEAVEISFQSFIKQKRIERLIKRMGSGILSLTQKNLKEARSR
ncbi:hypothetical protein MNBD_UNCLBAC01-227 [hydrothermal vent metagenome]|uniref:Uncharacterized protein n=1 Tax=hydrothermal vent metagenome TaxID=652676 RepID=A0A3B1DTN4_9ZZZZ